MGSGLIEPVLAKLRKHCEGRLTDAPAVLESFSRDFGGMVRRRPVAVLKPERLDDVVTALKIAMEAGLPVTTRGSGHSQAGQCVGQGLVLDMRGLARVLGVSEQDQLVEVEAGAQWKAVVDATFERRHLPRGLTHVLDTTVAGTLSVAGVGAESWRVGPQVDNVAFFDVATLEGQIVRTSLHERRDLFDAVRAGLGQCGVIVRAGYPLRACGTRVRSRYFVYSEVDRFMRGVESACEGRASFVFGALSRGRDRGGSWALLLVLGFEYEDETETDTAARLAQLAFDEELPEQDAPLWDASGVPGHLFFRLHAPNPTSLDADPTTLHPWIEHVLPRQGARDMLEELLTGRSPVLPLGTNGLIFVRRAPEPAPLFSTPNADGLLWGLGMFPSVPAWFGESAAPLLAAHAARGRTAGGKRYLSGFIDFERASDWEEHYGDVWSSFREAKQRLDPKGLLNPGFIRWA